VIKVIAFVRRHPSMSRAAFFDYWLNKHAALVKSVPEFWQYVRGYQQNHAIRHFSLDVEQASAEHRYDGCGEIWFDSIDDMKKAFQEPAYLQIIRPDERICFDDPDTSSMILAVEHVIVNPRAI
jgi:uncharacterized protein (TIGR02118 family)